MGSTVFCLKLGLWTAYDQGLYSLRVLVVLFIQDDPGSLEERRSFLLVFSLYLAARPPSVMLWRWPFVIESDLE